MPAANPQPTTNTEPVDAPPNAEEHADELDEGWDDVAPAPVLGPPTTRESTIAAPDVAHSEPATTAPATPATHGADTKDPRRFDVDKTLPSLQDLGPRPSREQADRRRFDVRAPRATRSTRDSQLFRAQETGPRPAPRAERSAARAEPIRDESAARAREERRRDPRAPEERDLRLPRRPDRGPRVVPDEVSPSRASTRRGDEERPPTDGLRAGRPAGERTSEAAVSRPSLEGSTRSQASTPRVSATASTERAPEPAAPSVEAELRVLGARPVMVKRPKKGGKPKTAREAMREKARALEEAREKAPKTLRSGEVAPSDGPDEPAASPAADDRPAQEPSRKKRAKPTAKHVEPVHETSADELEKARPRPSFWSRVKRFFGASES